MRCMLNSLYAISTLTASYKTSHRFKLRRMDELLTESLELVCSNSVLLRHRAVLVRSAHHSLGALCRPACNHYYYYYYYSFNVRYFRAYAGQTFSP